MAIKSRFFSSSKCCFRVCSISGDEIFTDCLDDAKCLIAWSLNDGREITRVKRNENIVSFAMSRDGKLLAISHSSGCVCLVDRENGFTTLAKTALLCVSGLISFTEDSRFLFCGCLPLSAVGPIFYQCFYISVDAQHNSSLDVTGFHLKPQESDCHSVGGFLLGDPLSSDEEMPSSDFVLNGQFLLRNCYDSTGIEMMYGNKLTESTDGEYRFVESLAFSSTGETIYMIVSDAFFRDRIMAWDVSNLKLKAEKELSFGYICASHILAARGDVLIATSRTLELWNFELSYCIRQWSLNVKSIFAISDDQVVCTTLPNAEAIIVDTVTGDIVSRFAVSYYELMACYRNLHLLANIDGWEVDCIKLQQLGQSVPRWKLSIPPSHAGEVLGCFSPKGQFIAIVVNHFSGTCSYVLDVVSGNVRFKLSDCDHIRDLKFISDEEFVILSDHSRNNYRLRLFSAWSGHLLSVLQFYSDLKCCRLATCPGEGLIAIWSPVKFDLKVINVKLSEGRRNASGMAKR